ncbi:uncharacterized protein LOC112344304 [Selaginella moellendorffii]|uniref:uncharacterized protein LOC112344304 n=1 Tax=Selaginella moellendorffii TaxID=88036 RepID=UPI000D1C70D6|nr:uncharacterized protein LOC112344304 [Selaginella moellendorffii]|eukprot:XP_024524517.1 uncharacterized protein LOC112344304 [Selaginella moellendorffii]
MKKRQPGGKGASKEAVKSRSSYNPCEIKKKREFYQNAKKVQKYKKLKKELDPQNEDGAGGSRSQIGGRRHRKRGFSSLERLRGEYERKKEEVEVVKEERAKENVARQQAREHSEKLRKQTKAKMFKKTSKGQPVMKFRLEQILNNVKSGKAQ